VQRYEWARDIMFPNADVVFLTSNHARESDLWLLWRASAEALETQL